MSEPFFPPPQKKESAPFRTAGLVVPAPVVTARRSLPAIVPPAAREPSRAPSAPVQDDEAASASSFLATFAWRFGVRVVSFAVVVGLLYGLVMASESGAKWPQLVIMFLGALGILAAPFVLFLRVRRLWRLLFARDDAG